MKFRFLRGILTLCEPRVGKKDLYMRLQKDGGGAVEYHMGFEGI